MLIFKKTLMLKSKKEHITVSLGEHGLLAQPVLSFQRRRESGQAAEAEPPVLRNDTAHRGGSQLVSAEPVHRVKDTPLLVNSPL